MEHLTNASRLPGINAEQQNGVYFVSTHPQATAAANSQIVPSLSTRDCPYLPVEDWLNPHGIELEQAARDTPLPGPGTSNLPSKVSYEMLPEIGYALTNAPEGDIQKQAIPNPALTSYCPNVDALGEPLLRVSNSPWPSSLANGDAPIFQCEWKGCRSTTVFAREADLIRHLKGVVFRVDRQSIGQSDMTKITIQVDLIHNQTCV
ncbi:predicted protein [Aspergillus nidulans FGSC A4]|nr:predicted protein [Aspergillus nidulans FGSC A4]|eukprot:XP_658353.1 predicted protein [Aspergillus nidulans FGSC A4]